MQDLFSNISETEGNIRLIFHDTDDRMNPSPARTPYLFHHFVNSVNFTNFVTHCSARPSSAVSLLLAWRPGFLGKLPSADSLFSRGRASFVAESLPRID